MEPASIFGLCASCVGVAYKAGKLVHDIHELCIKFKGVEVSLQFLKTEISAVKIATETISRSLDLPHVKVHKSLQSQLADTLDACGDLLALIQEHVSKATQTRRTIGFRSKINYLWTESSLNEYRSILQTQVQALQLILQCLQLPSGSTQQSLLSERGFEDVFDKVRNDAISTRCLRDKDTCFSRESGISADQESVIDVQFDFDQELMTTWVYRSAFRSLVKQKMKTRKKHAWNSASSVLDMPLCDSRDARSVLTITDSDENYAVSCIPPIPTDPITITGDRSTVGVCVLRTTVPQSMAANQSDGDKLLGPGEIADLSASVINEVQPIREFTPLPSIPKFTHLMPELSILPKGSLHRGPKNPGSRTGSKKVTFASEVIFYETWSNEDLDRSSPIAVCDRLTPLLAKSIKIELNDFRLTVS